MTAPAPSATVLRLHPDDDVVIALEALAPGAEVATPDGPVTVVAGVPAGHKLAVRALAPGAPVRRYGHVIGAATAPIRPGDHVHTHNLSAALAPRAEDLVAEAGADLGAPPPAPAPRTFDGFLRADGRAGTRNHLAVLSTVNCSASVCGMVADRFRDVARHHPGVDGVLAFTHRSGCGMVADGDAHRLLERVLAGHALHPNVAGYVVVGLGCEVNQPVALVDRRLAGPRAPRPPVITIQEAGGTLRAAEAAVREVARLLPAAAAARRTPLPLSKLVLATNCGGSDGYSGITANPALGVAVDLLVRHGGTAILGETTEIHGAERLLVRRAVRPDLARRLLQHVAWWRAHLGAASASLDENPSPGNRAGGITTILEKALGGVAKGGRAPLVDVVEYGEPAVGPGLVYMDTPGFDPVSVTGMIAGGANLVAFTTGRGSVFGTRIVPTLKLATTSALYRRMPDDMDVDCGVVLEGTPLEELGAAILDRLVEVASGRTTKSEALGLGAEEFAPWLPGPVV
ncbi:MAG TPA: altronate dehydratase family protein [Anaeromyxobacter sp.]|nr:altronate dehydratase family protein [Anaeromyxobacter sp.]